jgi:hypothetical protein
MDLNDRKIKIAELKEKFPKFKRMCSWYSVCEATRLCVENDSPATMDDSLAELLKKIEFELEELEKT